MFWWCLHGKNKLASPVSRATLGFLGAGAGRGNSAAAAALLASGINLPGASKEPLNLVSSVLFGSILASVAKVHYR